MSHKPLFGSASRLANMGSWKAGSPTSNPQRLKVAKSWISTILHCFAGVAIQRQPRSQSISCSPHLRYHNSIFCKHYATNELVERAAALRDLKLLEGSGGLDFTKGMDSSDKHVEQISFRHCIALFEHGNMGPTSKDGNKRPWRPQTKTSIWNFTVTGMSCLGSSEDKFWVQKMYGEK